MYLSVSLFRRSEVLMKVWAKRGVWVCICADCRSRISRIFCGVSVEASSSFRVSSM